MLDANGKKVLDFMAGDNPDYWSVLVAPGQDGKLWQLSNINGQVMLMTVPPYLAHSVEELLLPREAVKSIDGKYSREEAQKTGSYNDE